MMSQRATPVDSATMDHPPAWPLVVLVARTCALYGGQTALTTTLLLTFQASGASGGYLSAVLLAVSLPLMLVAPIAGALADRIPGRRLVVGGSTLQVVALMAQLLDPRPVLQVALVALFAAGMAVVAASLQVQLPTLVPVDRLGRATGWASAAQTTAFMTGPMAAAAIFDASGPRTVLFVVASACVAVLVSGCLPDSARRGGASPGPRGATSLVGDGLGANRLGGLWQIDRTSLIVVLYTGALALMLHPTAVIEVLLVRETLGASAATLGVVGAGWSAGMVCGSLLAGRLSVTTRGLTRWLMVSGAVQAAFLGMAGLSHAPWLLVALYVIGGFWCGATNVARQTLLTVRAPEGQRGRALSLVVAVHNGVQAIGLGLGGVVVELFDPRTGYVLCGVLGVVATLAFVPWLRATVSGASTDTPTAKGESERKPLRSRQGME